MSSSMRSRLTSPPTDPNDATPPDILRKSTSRIPTKSSNTTESKSKPVQHVSKLAKSTSRKFPPPEKGAQGKSLSSNRARAPSVASEHRAAPIERAPAVQSESAQSDIYGVPRFRRAGPSPVPTTYTPSLVSGSSVSTYGSPRPGLRRKPQSIDKYAAQTKAASEPIAPDRGTPCSWTQSDRETFTDSVLGISMPYPTTSATENAYYPLPGVGREWQVTPPLSNYASSATPSTRYADSPFSHVSIPSSTSSYSPAIYSTSGSTPRLLQQSPSRSQRSSKVQDSAISRSGMSTARESSTSSSNTPAQGKIAVPTSAHRAIPKKTPSVPAASKTSSISRVPPRRQSALQSAQAASVAPKAQPQIPPELAHLNVDPPIVRKPLPPRRPSRDGATGVLQPNIPSPIVQSDLPKLHGTHHKPTPFQETPTSPPTPSSGFRSRFGLSPRSSSKQASPRTDSAISPPPSAKQISGQPTPEVTPPEAPRLQRSDSPAVGSLSSASKPPRFGFLSRKSNSATAKVIEKPARQHIKGPAAGTGHEGYGRFGLRGRVGSGTSSTGFRSSSADSSKSNSARNFVRRIVSSSSSKGGAEMDDFLRERLSPRVLRGSGNNFSPAAFVSDNQPLAQQYDSSSPTVDSYSKPQLLPSAMQRERSVSSIKRHPLDKRLSPESSEHDLPASSSMSSARHSTIGSFKPNAEALVSAPASTITAQAEQERTNDSNDENESAWAQSTSVLAVTEAAKDGREGLWLRPRAPQIGDKSSKQWNFFQHAHATPRPKGKEKVDLQDSNAASDAHAATSHNAAHFALMDPVDPVDLYEVEQLVQDDHASLDDTASKYAASKKMVAYDRRHSGLLPHPPLTSEIERDSDFRSKPTLPRVTVRQDRLSASPELLHARQAVSRITPQMIDIPRSPAPSPARAPNAGSDRPLEQNGQHQLHTPQMLQDAFGVTDDADSSSKQPRLSPIGRIPMVISTRDRDRKLPETSFSRPFVPGQPHPSVKPPGVLYNQIRASRELTSPVDGCSQPVSSTSTNPELAACIPSSSNNTDTSGMSTNRTSMDVSALVDAFPYPRKGSAASCSTCSGSIGWATALVPPPPQQDDPWTEYNDLLDNMLPQKTPVSAGSSLRAPFQYSHVLHDSGSPSLPTPLNINSQPPSTKLPPPPGCNIVQPALSSLQSHSSAPEHYSTYGMKGAPARHRASLPPPQRPSVPQPRRASASGVRESMSSFQYGNAPSHSQSTFLPENGPRSRRTSWRESIRLTRDAQLLNIPEHVDDEQAAKANLRFAALMTSKWLSFGRVLFSPAHNEMRLSKQPKVLVLDGLGSDWSQYVALSYPMATVYNLGPTASKATGTSPGITQTPLPNHKHIPHDAIASAFPFPKGFFTTVVLRFPLATSDSAYHACIFECKRVLRPGGHLEVAALDLDLTNMGPRARSLIRGLKTRMQHRDPNISLRNLTDSLVRLLGRRGFEDLQRCIVGVPAAGRLPRSQSFSSNCSSDAPSRQPSLPGRQRTKRLSSVDKDLSFADLLEDLRSHSHSHVDPNASSSSSSACNSDEAITKMVAKVGRWWYASCYENFLLKDPEERSIWDDRALLRECQRQGTSFRLLICYAQKPAQARRRTVSV